jgi:hypothetical protein
MDLIMTFQYMHILYLDHIHKLHCSFLSPLHFYIIFYFNVTFIIVVS